MNTELIIATSGVVIAACAFGLSIYQARLSAKATRLSVRPHLQLQTSLFADNHHFRVTLENNGLGPAFIKKFEVYLDGGLVESGLPLQSAIDSISTPDTFMITSYYKEGYAIKDGQEKEVLKLSFINLKSDYSYNLESTIEEIVKRLRLEIHYTDGFGKEMKPIVSDNKL